MPTRPTIAIAGIILSATVALVSLHAADPAPASSATGAASSIARGRHLVDNIALCADCHTPRLPSGALDRSHWLEGSPLGFKPLVDMPWAPYAPSIAGLPAYTDEQAIVFLTTGKRPAGVPALPPMPEYRFSTDEARDVLAYLRSLKPAQP